MRRVAPLVALLLAALPARAHDLNDMIIDPFEQACEETGPGEGPCKDAVDVLAGLLGGVQRAGVSYADFRDDPGGRAEVANFYFNPRVLQMLDGQTIVFSNENVPGGNRHSVMSSDWGGDDPVLPVPGAAFGGGAGFRSEQLRPGETFTLTVGLDELHPDASVALPNGDRLIAYHCYIHGSSQMNGFLVVTPGTGAAA